MTSHTRNRRYPYRPLNPLFEASPYSLSIAGFEKFFAVKPRISMDHGGRLPRTAQIRPTGENPLNKPSQLRLAHPPQRRPVSIEKGNVPRCPAMPRRSGLICTRTEDFRAESRALSRMADISSQWASTPSGTEDAATSREFPKVPIPHESSQLRRAAETGSTSPCTKVHRPQRSSQRRKRIETEPAHPSRPPICEWFGGCCPGASCPAAT